MNKYKKISPIKYINLAQKFIRTEEDWYPNRWTLYNHDQAPGWPESLTLNDVVYVRLWYYVVKDDFRISICGGDDHSMSRTYQDVEQAWGHYDMIYDHTSQAKLYQMGFNAG